MSKRIQPYRNFEEGRFRHSIFLNDPKEPRSWVAEYDKPGPEGTLISVIYGDDPKDPRSWVNKYHDETGRFLAKIYGDDPKSPKSWSIIYDDQGETLSHKYGDGRDVQRIGGER